MKGAAAEEKVDLDHIRPDLAEYFERRALTLDDKRRTTDRLLKAGEEVRRLEASSSSR